MPAKGHNRGIVVSYGTEAHSALYQWQRRMQTRLGNAAVLWIARNYRRIPARAASGIGGGVGTLIRLLSPRHRRIVMTNLRIAFGQEKTEEELARIAAAISIWADVWSNSFVCRGWWGRSCVGRPSCGGPSTSTGPSPEDGEESS